MRHVDGRVRVGREADLAERIQVEEATRHDPRQVGSVEADRQEEGLAAAGGSTLSAGSRPQLPEGRDGATCSLLILQDSDHHP